MGTNDCPFMAKKSWLEWSLSPCPAVPAFAKTDPSSDLIQVCLALSGHENDIKWEQIKTQCIINRLSSFQRAFEFGYTPMILKAVWLFALSSGLEGFITLQKKYVRKDCTLLQLCFVCFVDRIFSSLMIYSSLKATILWYGIPRWNDTSIEGTPPLFFTNMWRCHLVITIAWKHLWFSGKTALSSCVSPCCMGSYPRLNEDKTILHVYKRDILLLSAHWRTVPFIGSTLHYNNKSVKIYLG